MLTLVLGILSFFTAPDFKNLNDSSYSVADTVKLPEKLRVNGDSGVYLQISRIFIIGNKRTRDQIILRELSLKPGDIVNSADLPIILDRDQKKLFNTRLFNTTNVKPLELEPGKIDLLVDVNERWYTFPSPRFALSDRNFNEWWQNYNHDFDRVIYGLKLYQYNMRGRNETLLLRALFGFQREFGVTYRMPYIDKKQKQGLIFNFEFTQTKNLAFQTKEHKLDYLKSSSFLKITRNAGLTYTYRNSFYDTHFLGAEYHSSWINDTVYQRNENYFGKGKTKQKYGVIFYQFVSDHRDVGAYPLKGSYTALLIQKLGLGLGDDVDKLETNLTYSHFFDLKKGFYFANYSNLYWSTPQNQPYINYGAVGYQKQFIKGYEVYVIEGPYYFLNKSTFKKRIFRRNYNWKIMPRGFEHIPLSIYLKTYGDFGYVNNYPRYDKLDVNNTLSNKWISGVGGGLDIFASYDVVIRLEYTWNGEGYRGFFFHLKKEF
jgi:outer membrane protein assembly factor BamA